MKTSKSSFGTVGFIEKEGTRKSLVASVPKGWRLMENWEFLRFVMENPKQTIFPKFEFIVVSLGVSYLVGLDGGSRFYADDHIVDYQVRRLRGVAVVKKEEKV